MVFCEQTRKRALLPTLQFISFAGLYFSQKPIYVNNISFALYYCLCYASNKRPNNKKDKEQNVTEKLIMAFGQVLMFDTNIKISNIGVTNPKDCTTDPKHILVY